MLEKLPDVDFQAFFEASVHPCFVLDTALNVVAANTAFYALTGTSRCDLVGRNVLEVFPPNPGAPASAALLKPSHALRRLLALQKQVGPAVHRYDLPRPDGGFNERYWRANSVLIRDRSETIRWIVVTVKDVTDRISPQARHRRLNGRVPRERAILDALRRHNYVLRDLDDRMYGLLADHLSPITLNSGDILHDTGRRLDFAHFLFGVLVAVRRPMPDGSDPAVTHCQPTGMSGASLLMRTQPMNQAIVVLGGPALRISADALLRLFAQRPALRSALNMALRWPAVLSQMTNLAACTSRHKLSERLARWLLDGADAINAPVLTINQEMIAADLGVRRTGVSEMLGEFAKAALLRSDRGQITLLDRQGLEDRACECRKDLKDTVAQICGGTPLETPSDRETIAGLFAAFANLGQHSPTATDDQTAPVTSYPGP